jgi:hypothetical protein
MVRQMYTDRPEGLETRESGDMIASRMVERTKVHDKAEEDVGPIF